MLDHPPLEAADVGARATEGLPTNMAKVGRLGSKIED